MPKLDKIGDAVEKSSEGINQSTTIARALVGLSPEIYGEKYSDHLLEQYRKYLEMADAISNRRSAANTFFLSVNTALISGFGLLNLVGENASGRLLVIGSIAAILLSYSWYRLIRAYRDLSTAKFKVVHEIEAMLPIRPFEAEWEAVGRGTDRKLYWPFTHIEKYVPWIFILLYLIIIYDKI